MLVPLAANRGAARAANFGYHAADMSAEPPSQRAAVRPAGAGTDDCPLAQVTRAQELIDNLPYLAMIGLGAAIFWMALGGTVWGGVTAAAYAAYGVGGAFWIMLFVCPYCHFFATRLCPCGYGQIAAKLRGRADGERFREQFRQHIPVIVPLWFLPVIAGAVALVREFSWELCAVLLVFAVVSFWILPLVSRKYGCAKCPQKATCPWMASCRAT